MLGRLGGRLCPAAAAGALAASTSSSRGITSLALRKENPDKCPPWPYRTRGYDHLVDYYWDLPTKRFDENSKLIVVEGNIGSGKSSLAKELADTLGFYHIPEFSMEDILINGRGVDRRPFYKFLPKSTAIPDMAMFYDDPYNPYNAQMQFHMALGKFENNLNAAAHIINTGQGVVMERSYHSDFAFVNACYEAGFYSYDFFRWYHTHRKLVQPLLYFWPHLVIYLDASVENCMSRIQKRGTPGELNGKVITPKYLDTIRQSYKDLMKLYDKHSRMLVYDWNTAADIDQVVEDIEAMDLDSYEWHDGEIHEEWSNVYDGWEWNERRHEVTNKTSHIHQFLDILPTYEVDELHCHPEEHEQFLACMKVNVMGPYAVGHDPKLDGIWPSVAAHPNAPGMLHGYEFWELGAVRWYEHYYRDAWWNEDNSMFSVLDFSGKEQFNPHYHHH